MKKLYLLGFIFALHIALAAYVNSTFLSQFVGENLVGLLYTISAIMTLIIFGYSSFFIKYIGNKKLMYTALAINIAALTTLSLVQSPIILIVSFIAFSVTNSLVIFSLDILFEDLEKPASIGRMRGIYLSVINVAWIFSPIFSGYIIESSGYGMIYGIGAALALSFVVGLSLSNMPDNFSHKKVPLWKTIFRLKNDEGIRDLIAINFLLQLFFAIMIVYTPIYLVDHIGFGWDSIGVIFTIMLIPFIIFGLPVGKAIDRGMSEKKLLHIGICFIAFATTAIAFITTKSIAVWAILLLLTRVGATILENTTEVYLFKKITPEDTDILSLFRDMSPVAYLIAPIIVMLIISVLPFKSIFIILGAIMLYGIRIVRKLK